MKKIFSLVCVVLIVIIIVVCWKYNNNSINISNNAENSIIINSTNDVAVEEIEVSSFSTPLSGDDNRRSNISLSCSRINGTVISSGETFSFNKIIGDPTEELGYKKADVFVGAEIEKDFGGGNCQVSSTLYNACLEAENIEIVERTPHERKVSYVEENKDATISYDTIDFKFKNNNSFSIKIYMSVDNNYVNVKFVKV